MNYIEIGLHVNCNFRCGYCISEQQDHWTNLTSLDKDQLIRWLNTHTQGHELVSLTGGEPFLWNGIEELVTTIPNRILLNTNLSLLDSNRWVFDEALRDRMCFRIGLHPTVRSDDYVDKIQALQDFGYHYIINYMVSVKEIENNTYNDTISRLDDLGFKYEVSYEIDTACGTSYRNKIPETSTQFEKYNFIDQSKGIVIRSNGNILRCQSGRNIIGRVQDNTLNDDMDITPRYCYHCMGLKGFTKVLSTWDKFDLSTLYPNDDMCNKIILSDMKKERKQYQS